MNIQAGYAYVEVMIATIILVTALVPAADALREVAGHAEKQRTLVGQRYEAIAEMESVLAKPFAELFQEAQGTGGLAESSYSELVGTPYRKIIFVSPYDIDDADGDQDILTGTDTNVVRVALEVENTGIFLETLIGSSS